MLRGCDGPAPHPVLIFDDEPYYECPGKVITQGTIQVLNTIALCESMQVLPVAGGLNDQAESFLQAFSEVKSVIVELEKEEAAKEKK